MTAAIGAAAVAAVAKNSVGADAEAAAKNSAGAVGAVAKNI